MKLHTQNQLLNEISRASQWHGRPASDYRLAKLLKASSSSAVGNWRSGRTIMSPEFAMRAADLLAWPHAYVLACVEAERAERDAAAAKAAGRDPLEETNTIVRTWRAIGEHFRPKHAAVILLAALSVAMGLFSPPAHAHARVTSAAAAVHGLYLMRSRARRWIAAVWAILARFWCIELPELLAA